MYLKVCVEVSQENIKIARKGEDKRIKYMHEGIYIKTRF
jgi:hypothetical protein